MADLEVVQESGFDIDNEMIIGIGLATTFAVVAIVYFVLALDQNMNNSVEIERQRRGADYVAYKVDQDQKLDDTVRWADKDRKLVAVPTDMAKKIVAQGIPTWAPPPEEKPAAAPAAAPSAGAPSEDSASSSDGDAADGDSAADGQKADGEKAEAPSEADGAGVKDGEDSSKKKGPTAASDGSSGAPGPDDASAPATPPQ